MRLPHVPNRLGLGVGLDLPWGAPIGFQRDAVRGDTVSDRVVRFLGAYATSFAHLFVSWQPKDRNRLRARDYFAAYDDLFARSPTFSARALHQTALNLGALEDYDRSPVIDFTNELAARYGLAWVNEDLGLWSIHGRPLPYPLPPYLTAEGLRAAVRNTSVTQARLAIPLLVEFPGFSDEVSFVVGGLHAYDFFRLVVEETGSAATLDTGHLLSYQWLCGKRGAALYDELERLPTQACFEIHLSGCEIVEGRFVDYHHGVLMNEQLELLRRLLPLCPNLRAVTYEDPKFEASGELQPETKPSFEALAPIVADWVA